jgi:hypothetical protein
MKWLGHVARIRERETHLKLCSEDNDGKSSPEDLDKDRTIILVRASKKRVFGV